MPSSFCKNNCGQSLAIEYAVLFFIVTAVIVAMSSYVKRAVQGRVHDARNYMYIQVNGVYNQMHPNRILPSGYDPYYSHTRTDKAESTATTEEETPLSAVSSRIETGISSTVDSTSTSETSSPRRAQ